MANKKTKSKYPWSVEEENLLKTLIEIPQAEAYQKFQEAGFKRTQTAFTARYYKTKQDKSLEKFSERKRLKKASSLAEETTNSADIALQLAQTHSFDILEAAVEIRRVLDELS